MDIGAGAYKASDTGISEFQSPLSLTGYRVQDHLALLQPRLFWQLFTLLACVGVAAARKRLRLVDWLLLLGFTAVYLMSNKNFGYFVFIVFPLAAQGLTDLAHKLKLKLTNATLITTSAASLAVTLAVSTGWWFAMSWFPYSTGTGFSNSVLPVAACEFLNEHNIEGRVINTWDNGGYIHFATHQPVFIYSHGEVMTQDWYTNTPTPNHPPASTRPSKTGNPPSPSSPSATSTPGPNTSTTNATGASSTPTSTTPSSSTPPSRPTSPPCPRPSPAPTTPSSAKNNKSPSSAPP